MGEEALGARLGLAMALSSCFVVWAVVQGRGLTLSPRCPLQGYWSRMNELANFRSAVPTLLLLFAVTTAVVAVFL